MNITRTITLTALAITIIAIVFYAANKYDDFNKDLVIDAYNEEIISLMAFPEDANFHDKIDYIREYIASHSEININEEFYSIWRSQEKILSTFIAGIKKERDTFVPLECATRTGIMQGILLNLGYNVRTLYVYNAHTEALAGHVILDVFNPDTGKWESQDSRYDLYWKNIETGQRVSFVDIIGKADKHQPCNTQKCGWAIVSHEGEVAETLRNHLSIVSVVNKQKGVRQSFYDPKILSPDKRFSLNGQSGTFCELVEKNCRQGFIPVRAN